MHIEKFAKFALVVCLLLMVTAVAIPNPQEKQYKDRAEYDLISKVYGEANPAQKLVLLKEWEQKYPETDYSLERDRFYLDSYQKTNNTPEAIASAKRVLAASPGEFTAHYVITLSVPYLGKADDATIGDGVAAAKAVLAGADQQFGQKPDQIPQAAWDNAKTQALANANLTLGWCSMQRKDDAAAAASFEKVLAMDPSRGQVSYWLGQVTLNQQDASKYDLAFFHFARAGLYDGPGAMPPEGRQQVLEYVQTLLKKNYGEESFGIYWPKFEEMAEAGAAPTARVELKSDEEMKFEEEQASRKANPALWVYKDLKTTLLGPSGDSTWSELRGKLTPKMALYVVSASPPERPATINLTSERGGRTEVVLNLENRRRTGVRSGSMLTIDGVAGGLTRQPFRLTLSDGHTFP